MTHSPLLGPLRDRPTISVISTVYQHERFVERALTSVLEQDWPADQLEYIVVNDGSTDGSRAILDRYAAEHPSMRVIHQANGGLKAAINTAMAATNGDLIRAVSGDDMLAPGALRAAAEHMIARPHVGLLHTDMTVIDGDDRVIEPSFMRANGKEPFPGRPLGQLLSANFVSGGSVMLRGALREIFHPLPTEAAWEDYWWAWRVAQVADIDYLDISTYLYRDHGSNMSYGAGGTKMAESFIEEIRFRRHMLSTVEPGQVSATWAMRGWGQLLRMATMVAETLGHRATRVLAVTDEQRREAEAEGALAFEAGGRGDVDLAAVRCVRALARDPHREDLRTLARGLHAATKNTVVAPIAQGLDVGELRGFVALADAAELIAAPELLETYAATFGADDDATLLIHAADWSAEQVERELLALMARCGVDAETGPDLAAHTGPETDRGALLGHAHALLCTQRRTAYPAFGAGQGHAIRAWAERQRPAPRQPGLAGVVAGRRPTSDGSRSRA